MAIGITLLYILTQLLGAARIFGGLAEFRSELVLSVIAVLVTLPSVAGSGFLRSRMTLSVVALVFVATLSVVLKGWLGGFYYMGYLQMPALLGFFLVAINCRTRLHMQLVILTLFCGCAFDVYMGHQALQEGGPSPFIYVQGFGEGQQVSRIKGEQFIADPNDFAQVMVAMIPLMFFFGRKGSVLVKAIFVLPAVGVLFIGIYLTHSRGGLVALLAMAMFAARRKIGLIPSAIAGVVVFAGALAAGMTGGREVSTESGADRISLWAAGLHMIRLHPLFGVGAGNFRDFAPNTAHNSVVICAAELGLLGLLCWISLIFITFRTGLSVSGFIKDTGKTEQTLNPAATMCASTAYAPWMAHSQPQMAEEKLPEPKPESTFSEMLLAGTFNPKGATLPGEEIRRLSGLLIYALIGFLTAGWFLSRAYTIWLMIFCAMIEILGKMAIANGIAVPRDPWSYTLRWSAIIGVALLTIISIIIRVTGVH